ncbi:MAG: leucine-rich repeat protein [Bacteroidaceae bacterium]|nr:leucine-rich repeat protein [Bacteroidaceae bacterium]
MRRIAFRQFLCLIFMLVLSMGRVFSQNVVDLGTGLNGVKYYESMNAANPPTGDWYAVDYDDSGWESYTDPLDYPMNDAFWLRRAFIITDNPANHTFQLKIAHDRLATFYVNGQQIHSCWGCGRYSYYDVPSSYLVCGINVLSVYAYDDDGGSRYLECVISTSDGSNIVVDYPTEPMLFLSESELRLYMVEGYSDLSLNAQLVAPSGLIDSQYSWTSSNPDVVSVINGQLEALSAGNAVVTATTTYNGVSYSKECEVEVRAINPNSRVVFVDVPGTLGSLLTDDEKESIDDLTLFGKLDGNDIQVLRYMAGRNEKGNRTPGVLADLDIYNVEFVTGNKGSFQINNDNSSYIETGKLPWGIFRNCATLNIVVLPRTVSQIGSEAFRECTNLQHVEIPNNITKIDYYAFYGCSNLKVIELPASISTLGYELFYDCRRLESVVFADNIKLTTIPDWAFYNTNIRSLTIPASVTSIGNYSFYNIGNLVSVDFEAGSQLIEIKQCSFGNCDNLQKIILPEGCLEIGNESFRDCDGLTSISIPSSLVSLGNEVFRYCNALTEIIIPQNSKLTSIGSYAFDGTNVTSFYIPKGLTSISDIFSNTSRLQSLTVHPDNRYYESVGGIVYGKRDHSVILVPKSIDGYLTFPDYVTTIPENLLQGCSRLKGLILHSGITNYGENAFSGCSGLQTLMNLSATPATISSESLNGIDKSVVTLVVPQGSVSAYASAEGWSDFENIVEVSDVPTILLSTNDVIVYDVSYESARTSTISASVITKDGIAEVPVTWTTSDSSVATVNNGIIEYAGEGSTTVIASVTVGEYTSTASCNVTSVGMSNGKMVYVEKAGDLSTMLTDAEKDDLTHLIVMGNLNNDDIRVLRYMAGRDVYGNMTVGSLEVLDMGKARIVSGGGDGYLYRDGWWRSVGDNYFSSEIFSSCRSLKKVVLPSTLTTLEYSGFSRCENLEEVVIPDGLTYMGSSMFSQCAKLSKVNIPSSVTNLSNSIFYGCSSLKTIDLSSMTGVNMIPEQMFCESGLTNVSIPANITNIGNYAFYNTPLKSVVFDNESRLATISYEAFGYTKLETVTIPASVTSIGDYAFVDCRLLTSISYSENNKLTTLGENVFRGCPINTFKIPKKLISMGSQDFADSITIVVEDGNKFFESIDGVLYTHSDNSLVYAPKYLKSIYLPDFVTSIKTGALRSHNNLETLVLTSSFSDLGENPFTQNYNMKEVYCMNTTPPTVRSLNGWGGRIYIPVGCKKAYEDANWDSWMLEERSYSNSVVLSASSVTLYSAHGGNSAVLTSEVFSDNGPVQYSSVMWSSSDTSVVSVDAKGQIAYVGPGTATVTASVVLNGSNYSAECDVTSIQITDSENAYYLNGQGNLRSLISMDDKYNIEKLVLVGTMADDDRNFIREMSGNRWENELTVTGKLAFLDMELLTDTIVGSYYFEGCNSLTSVILPNNTVSIGYRAFSNCTRLASIQIPESVKTIGNEAFYVCSNLETIHIPVGVSSIGSGTFNGCSSLITIQIPTGVSSIGDGAFYGCSSLEAIQIPDSVKTIEQSTFYGCSSLKTIQIPAGVSSIEWGAFYNCSSLRVIRMLSVEAPDIRSSVFEGIPMGTLCVIVPSGSAGYQTKNYWRNLTNIYEEDVLPMMVISKKSIELYNLSDTTSNSETLSAYAITLDGITTSGISWISSDTTIATVSQEGQVFFDVAEGEVTITASYTEDDKTVSSSCKAYIVDISDYKIVDVAEAGTLSTLLTEEEKYDIKKLIVTGSLNNDDIRVLRYMAGRDENGNVTAGSLEVLNISKAKIVSGGEGYYYQDGWWRNVSDNHFGSEVFSSCNSLKKIVLPSSLYSIEYNAFYGCTNLEEVVLPEGLNYIGSSAFSECRKLSKVNIPSSVTSISNYIFSGCISLKTIDLSTMTGINRVPDYMFYRSGIMSVIIPANITNINNGAFYETPLKTVSFEEGSKLATIGNNSFQSTKLQSITIPASVTSIGNYAFNDCRQLSVVIYAEDNKLSSLGNNVFDGCPIDTFFIPKRLLSMGSQNFSECQIVVEDGNKFFESIDGVLSSKSDNSLLYVPNNKTIVYLPDYVTTIKNGVLQNHNNLSTLVLTSTIADLGESPFCGSYGLSEIYCMNPEPPTVRYLTNGWSGKVYIPAGSKKSYIEADWDSTMLVERVFDYSITLSTGNMKLYNVNGGNKRGLSALLFTPTGPTMTGIEWSSDNPSVVSVDNHGIISYVDEGEAVITARAVFEDTILTAACRVNNIELDANSNVYYVTAGKLSTLIPEERKYDITDLILLGEINADDIRFIREMAGIDNNNNKTEGKLARLNMEAVNVVYGGSYWSCRWGTSYNDDNKLGPCAFADCKALEEVILPSNLTSLRNGVFYECDKLRSVTLPSLISSIPEYSFYNCKSLTNVYIPENVSNIYYEAFAYCTSLKSVISLCNTPADMDWSAFNGLSKGNITLLIPKGTYNAYLKNSDWKEFKTITEMDQLPMLILGYNSLSLYNFNSLGASDRTIPATVVTKYGVSDTFVSWTSSNTDAVTVNNGHVAMTTVPGSSVITATAIVDNDTLTAICNVRTNFIDADNAYYVEAGNLPNLIPEEQKDSITKLVLFGELNGTDIRFIREMAGISEYYWGNPGNGTLEYLDLSNATIVSGGRDYGEAQYVYNDNGDWSSRWEYTENDVIGNGMFRKSNSLKTIILPNNIKKIGSYAFDECPKLEEVLNMPSTVTELSSRALYGFDVVYTSNTTPMDLENSSLLSDGSVIVVPATSLDAYRTADNWKEFKTQIIPDNIQTTVSLVVTAEEKNSGLLTAAGSDENLSYIMDLTLSGTINGYDIGIIRNRMPILRNLDLSNVRIVANPFKYYLDSHTENNRLGNDAFREMNKLRRVVLPKTIDYIGANAFSDCENLSSIKMFEGLNTIDYYAFANCRNLIDVELPEGLLSIGNGAFSSCNRMETISLPNSLLSIGSSAFSNCYSLKSIVLPKNVSRIDWETFWYCTSLESVVLPAKVNRIEYYAFYGCSKLKELRLPPMIESIGDRAFYDCGNIKDVYVYIANSKDIRIDQNTFSCWKTATLHIPTFSYESYYWDTQWMQFYEKVEFQDTYDEFYTKNTLELNTKTGVIEGDPNAVLYEQGGLVVDDIEQVLDEVELKSDGTDGASLIASGEGSIKASKLIININVSAYRWHFFCFPFDIPLDSMKYDGEYVWRQYDGEARSRREGGWQDLAAGTTVLSKGRGYIFQGTITGSLSFTITNPDLSAKDETTGLFTHESQNAQDANWNFVGNPYTSYFNIDETSYSAPITVWTGYGYEAYRPGDDDYDLAPYQAFFVQTPDNTDEINFNADGRESYEDKEAAQSGRQAARRAAAREQVASGRLFINLEITADGESSYADKTRVVFNDSKSMDYEQNCDAAKFFSDASTIELYSVDANGAKYSINERPVGDGTVELGIKVNTADTYTIKAVRMDTPVLLFDKELNVTYDLSEGGYTFWTDKCESQRFVLKTSDTSLTKVLEVKNGAEQEDKIYDLQGRQLDDADAKGVIIINGKKVLGNN